MSLSALSSRLEPHLHHLLPRIKAQALLASAIVGLTSATLIAAIRDYRAYLALGRGGLSHNIIGWLGITLVLRPLALSHAARLGTAEYPRTGASPFVRNLRRQRHRRRRPAAPLDEMLRSFATARPEELEVRRSHYELHHGALYVAPALLADAQTRLPRTARVAKGGIAHVHTDRSVHLYLHPSDARVVVEKGWRERHRLSRTWPWWLGDGEGKLGLGHTVDLGVWGKG